MLEVVLARGAAADIEKIAQYSKAQWGEAQAKRYVQELREQIDFAAEFPGIGSQATGLPPEYRKVISGSHRAIYRCTATELIVVRILHEREDAPDEIEDYR